MRAHRYLSLSVSLGTLLVATGCRGLASYPAAPSRVEDAATVDAATADVAPFDGHGEGVAADSGDGPASRDLGDMADQQIGPDAPVAVDEGHGDVMLTSTSGGQFFAPRWDLTRCPLALRATIDFSKLTSASSPAGIFVQVGLRAVGGANVSPAGAGGWLSATPPEFLDTDPRLQGLDDKLVLKSDPGAAEGAYDVDPAGQIVAPFGTSNNHGIWFDRDGNDPTTESCSGPHAGLSYCTGGVYPVVVEYRAAGPKQGTMVATVNGMAQGFNKGPWKLPPDIVPAGKSFAADITNLQLFVGLITSGVWNGPIFVRSIKLTGCKAP